MVFYIFLFYTDYSLSQWVPNSQISGIGTYQYDTIGNSLYCAIYASGIYRSTNYGLNWVNISGSQIPTAAFNVVHNTNYIFAGFYNNGVYRTSNNGMNWIAVNNGFPTQNWGVRALIVRGSNIFAGLSYLSVGVYKSTNNGDNWILTDTSAHFQPVNCFANLGEYLFASGYRLYRTSNEGVNWVKLITPLDSIGIGNSCVNGNNIYIAGSVGAGLGGIYVSSDYGINWQKINSQIMFVSVFNNNIFGGYASSFFVSSNNGANWVNRSEGLTNGISSIFSAFGYVYLGTGTGGPPAAPVIWRRPFAEIVGVKKISTEISSSYSLFQNYPNPFNPSTIIKFQIKDLRYTTLKVYNILGKEITTLVNEKQVPGVYEVDWNASEYPSGVYYYRLVVGDLSEVKKMLLIK